MNLWMVNHYANPPHEAGDGRHYSHARELMSRGHDVRIIACNFHHLKHEYMPIAPGRLWEHRLCEAVPFTFISATSYKKNYEVARIVNMVQFAMRVCFRGWARTLQKPDVVLGSSPDPFAALAAERLATHYRVPLILEIRDPWPYTLTEIGGHSRYHPFVQLIDRTMRYLYSRAARIVMFSGHSAGLLGGYGADIKKILWVPHGVDLNLNPPPQPAPQNGKFTVTYLGAHNQWNSLFPILDAAKLLDQSGVSDVLIRFVGDGESKPGLVAKAKAERIRNVRFDDPVPKKQVRDLLHTSNAFIINNRKDGVSREWMSFNKIYDYLAAGRPVVFGSCTESDPVKESGAGISVEADNPIELSRAISILASKSPDQLRDLGARGRLYIEANYSISKLVDRFEQAMVDVAGEPASHFARRVHKQLNEVPQ